VVSFGYVIVNIAQVVTWIIMDLVLQATLAVDVTQFLRMSFKNC